MATLDITCTCCPLGCPITVERASDGSCEYLKGAVCGRGQKYAVAEATQPVRMVTASISIAGRLEPLSVKTAQAIPKILIEEAVEEIKKLAPQAPIACGSVLCDNLCGTGVAVVATKDLP